MVIRKTTQIIIIIILANVSFGCSQDNQQIKPYQQNSMYWQYNGKPVLLLGGSDDDNLFQWPEKELISQLNLLVDAGGNYIRNTMSDRKDRGFEVYPFKKQENGKYDLNKFSDEYWRRFERLLRETKKRNIIVQIEIWDRFDYTSKRNNDRWIINPYNPKNNVNYTYEESGFVESYPDHPCKNKQPFFFTTPKLQNNRIVLQYQEQYVNKMLDYSLQYNHILYCMDNETNADEKWGSYWAKFLKDRASNENQHIYVTEMWDDWELTADRHKQTFDHPELYDFVDVSQNNHLNGQNHWDNFLYVREYLSPNPRPINTTKTYGADESRYGTANDAVERFWRHLLAGAASIRFHRPSSGLGITKQAQIQIKSARMLLDKFDVFNSQPDVTHKLLDNRDEDEAYLSYIPKEQYAVFFPDTASVYINSLDKKSTYSIEWLNIDSVKWESKYLTEDASEIYLETPKNGKKWIALVTKTK